MRDDMATSEGKSSGSGAPDVTDLGTAVSQIDTPIPAYPATPAAPLLTRSRPRLLDTRTGSGKVGEGQILRVPVLGPGGVPATGVSAVAVNVTVDQPSGPGFVTVFPCGGGVPLASNLNYATGQVVANVATSPVGDGGAVCIFTWAATHVIVDVSGYFT